MSKRQYGSIRRLPSGRWQARYPIADGQMRSAPQTFEARDRQALGVFMSELGARPLAAITPMHVQASVDARAKLAAPATVARDFSALRAVFNAGWTPMSSDGPRAEGSPRLESAPLGARPSALTSSIGSPPPSRLATGR